MKEPDLDSVIKGNAYKIFLVELDKHLQRAHSIFLSKSDPSQTEFVQVGASFHTIRGGAGFFGLSDLAQKAARLEALLLSTRSEPLEDLSEVRSLISEVDRLARALPPAC